jgi:hypothetical protein
MMMTTNHRDEVVLITRVVQLIKKDGSHMNFLPELTGRTLTLTGGLLATGAAAVVAETTITDPALGTSSFLLGGAGLIAAISTLTKDYWNDRQRQREHEVVLAKLSLGKDRTREAVNELYQWARKARLALETLPEIPEIHLENDQERQPQIQAELHRSDSQIAVVQERTDAPRA